MFPEEVPSEPSTIEPMPLPIDASTSFQPQYIDDFHPLNLNSAKSVGYSNYNSNSTKITEHEIWDMPSSNELTNYGKYQDLSPFTRPPSHQQSLTTSTIENSHDRKFIFRRANSANDKPHDFSESFSSSESQSLPKRRYSSAGGQYKPVAIQTTDPEANIASADKQPEARPLAKSSHSIIERKYRENINTKITQLDQTLFDIRHPSGQPGEPKTDEHPNKTSKAEVLNGAMRYVKQAELESEARIKEIDFLRLRVAALEKLVNCADCALLKQMSDQQISNATNFEEVREIPACWDCSKPELRDPIMIPLDDHTALHESRISQPTSD